MLNPTEIAQLIADVESGVYTIEDAFADIAAGQYGEDVRKAMYAGLLACYNDGKTGATDAVARQNIKQLLARMDTFTQLEEGSTTGDAEVADARISADGYIYTNVGGNIRGGQEIYNSLTGNPKQGLVLLPAEKKVGVINRTDKTINTGNAVYYRLEYELQGEKFLCIDGYQYSAASGNYVLYIFLDASNNVIDYYKGGSSDTFQRHVWAAVPSGAVKIIINIREDANQLTMFGALFTPGTPIAKNVESLKLNNINADFKNVGVFRHGMVRRINAVEGTSIIYASIYYEIPENAVSRHFSMRGYQFSVNYPMCIVLDENNNIIYRHTDASDDSYVQLDLILPATAVKIYVNGRLDMGDSYKPSLKLYGETLSLETMVDRIITPKQRYGSTPVTDAECDKFREAYGMMLHRMMLTYPNAEIWCATITPCERIASNTGFPDLNSDKNTIEDYNRAIRELADAFGCKTINHDSCGISYYNLSDYMGDYASSTGFGLHPNAAGMSILARATVQALTNNGMYADYSDKKLSIMGDSISSYSGHSIWTQAQQYPAYDVTSINDMWWYKACIDELGMTLVSNNSYGGRAVSNIRDDLREDTGCFHQEQIDLLASGSTEPDVIIIKVGVNDFGNVGSDSNTVTEDGGKIRGGLGFYDGTTPINSEN